MMCESNCIFYFTFENANFANKRYLSKYVIQRWVIRQSLDDKEIKPYSALNKLHCLLPPKAIRNYDLRSQRDFKLPKFSTNRFFKTFCMSCIDQNVGTTYLLNFYGT
jgi:hypothetical protein